MKAAHVIFFALLVLLLAFSDGCAKSTDVEMPALEDISVDPVESPAVLPPSPDEAQCTASAQKWLKDAEGLLEQTLREQPSGADKVTVLCHLLSMQGQIGDRESAAKNFDRALDLISKEVRPENADDSLNGLAVSAHVAGWPKRARKAESMARTYNKYSRFSFILADCIAKKDFAPAMKAVREIDDDSYYRTIAIAQARAGLWDDAKETADFLVDRNSPLAITAFCEIAKCEVQAGRVSSGEKSFARAEEILQESDSVNPKDYHYSLIAKAEAEAGLFDAAEKDLCNVRNGHNKYPVLIMLAESKYKAGNKEKAAAYLEQAKKDASDANNDKGKVDGLCRVAVAESEFVSQDQAWKTIQEAREIHEDILEKSRGFDGPWMFSMEARYILQAEFEAGFRKQALAEAESQKIALGHRACAMSEIALLYAQEGDFARVDVVMGRMREYGILNKHMGFECTNFLNRIIGMKIRAGAVNDVPELVVDLEKVLDPMYRDSEAAKLLVRAGFEDQVEARYASMQEAPCRRRFDCCIGAAVGYLQRIKDAQSTN